MKNIYSILLFILISVYTEHTYAQNTQDSIRTVVDKMPESTDNLLQFLNKNLHYPDDARENNIQGRVLAKFIVNEDGSLSDITIIKSVGGGCDEEVIRVVSLMQKWKPGIHQGKPVKVYYTLPVVFKLEGGSPRKHKRKKD